MFDKDRPPIDAKCRHDGRPGVVCATYPTGQGFSVVGRYLDVKEDSDQDRHFVCPWSDCQPEALAA